MRTEIRLSSNGKFKVTIEDGCYTYINDKCNTIEEAISWMKQKEKDIKNDGRR